MNLGREAEVQKICHLTLFTRQFGLRQKKNKRRSIAKKINIQSAVGLKYVFIFYSANLMKTSWLIDLGLIYF